MYADLNCTCFCTKQMLTADASVVGVYKCLCSLLNVLVSLLLEIDFKRVYFIHAGAFGPTRDECFQTSPGKHCCVQVPFVFAAERWVARTSRSIEAFRWTLNVKRKQHKSKRRVWMNWDRKNVLFFIFFAKLSYFICMDFDSPREAVLWVLHSMRWQWLVGQMYAENKDRYGYYYNHRLAIHGVMAAEEESKLGWLFLVFWPKCYWILSSDTQRCVDRLSELPKFSMKDENKKWIISVRLISALLPFILRFSVSPLRNVHILTHTGTHKATFVYGLVFGLMHFTWWVTFWSNVESLMKIQSATGCFLNEELCFLSISEGEPASCIPHSRRSFGFFFFLAKTAFHQSDEHFRPSMCRHETRLNSGNWATKPSWQRCTVVFFVFFIAVFLVACEVNCLKTLEGWRMSYCCCCFTM